MMDFDVILVCPNASTRFGGEAMLPVHYYRVLSERGQRVTLIAHDRNRADLTEHFNGDVKNIHFIKDTWLMALVWRIGSMLPNAIKATFAEPLLNILQGVAQNRIIKSHLNDDTRVVVHVPTPVSPKAPSIISGFDAPVIFGPMNGGMDYPEGYNYLRSKSEKIFVRLARISADFVNILLPAKRRAAALLVANKRTEDALPRGFRVTPQILVENGVNLALWSDAKRAIPHRVVGAPFRLIYSGRLIKLKALDVTLQAVALARDRGVDVHLDIAGDGPERPQIEAWVQQLNLTEHARFLGFLLQKDVAAIMANADALILNSVRECGGAVVLEAMCLGLPVIASDWGGPADYLDDSCGRLVSPVPADSFAERLSDRIVELASDPELARELGRKGRKRVIRDYDWDRKADKIIEIYRQVLLAEDLAP